MRQITVGELIEELRSHHPDALVFYMWDGVGGALYGENLYLSGDGQLIIDCDANQDKDWIQERNAAEHLKWRHHSDPARLPDTRAIGWLKSTE